MSPTLTFSLNAIDHPAFSPVSSTKSYIANLSPSLVTHTKDAATSHSVPRIPYKFFATREYDGVRSTPRATKDPKGVTTRSINQATHPTAAAATLRHGLPPKTAAPSTDLPDLPGWALGILVGALTFLLVVAVVLFVAQFPPRLGWLRDIERKWKGQAGYAKLDQHDRARADEDVIDGGESSAVASSDRSLRCGQLRSLKKRSRPTLSIDTGVGVSYDAAALGVVVPRDDGEMYEDHMHGEHIGLVEKKRHSYDEEALRMQPKSPIVPAWSSFTAPLPAASTFTGGRRSHDVEARPYSLSAGAISTPDLFDFKSYQQDDGSDNDDNLGSSLLRRVNGGIYQAADKLSKAFYDQVTAPEEGLLLPVHEGDREKALGTGVFVG